MRKLLLIVLITLTVVSFYGCASLGDQSAGGGAATYQYKHTNPDGTATEVSIASGRDVSEANIEIGEDGSMKATASKLDSQSIQKQTLDALTRALGLLGPVAPQ